MRFRDGEQLDPGAARELAAVDAALAGRAGGRPRHERARRADAGAARPSARCPSERFARDARRDGRRGLSSASEDGRCPQRRGLPGFLRPRLRLAMATVASVFIVARQCFSSGVLDGDERAGVRPATARSPRPRSASDGSAAARVRAGTGAQAPAGRGPAEAPATGRRRQRRRGAVAPQPLTVVTARASTAERGSGRAHRKVERQAALTLRPLRRRSRTSPTASIAVDRPLQRIRALLQCQGGDARGRHARPAHPVDRLAAALADLSAARPRPLAHAEHAGRDRRFVSTRGRLRRGCGRAAGPAAPAGARRRRQRDGQRACTAAAGQPPHRALRARSSRRSATRVDSRRCGLTSRPTAPSAAAATAAGRRATRCTTPVEVLGTALGRRARWRWRSRAGLGAGALGGLGSPGAVLAAQRRERGARAARRG